MSCCDSLAHVKRHCFRNNSVKMVNKSGRFSRSKSIYSILTTHFNFKPTTCSFRRMTKEQEEKCAPTSDKHDRQQNKLIKLWIKSSLIELSYVKMYRALYDCDQRGLHNWSCVVCWLCCRFKSQYANAFVVNSMADLYAQEHSFELLNCAYAFLQVEGFAFRCGGKLEMDRKVIEWLFLLFLFIIARNAWKLLKM